MNKQLSIFFSIDKNYVQHFSVALTSLLENNKDLDLKIFVINDLQDMGIIDKTKDFIKNKYGVDLHFINIGNRDFSIFATDSNYTNATYFRLFLEEIIPEEIEVGLILDSDLIITGSIRELVEIDMSNHYVYAANEAFVEHNVNRFKDLGISTNSYFNAGVMLINLKAWRKENLKDKFIAIAEKYMSKLEWYDQDILNIFFADKWGEFDKKFNAVHLQQKLPVTPIIIHYASYSKPWHYVDTHPYNGQYWKYLKIGPYKASKASGFTLTNFILKNGRLFKRLLRRSGIIK